MCDKFYGVANGKQFVKAILVIIVGSFKNFLEYITRAHSTIIATINELEEISQ